MEKHQPNQELQTLEEEPGRQSQAQPQQPGLEPEYYQPNEKVNWFSLPKHYALGMKRHEKYKTLKPVLAAVIGAILALVFMVAATGICMALQSLFDPDSAVDFTTLFSDASRLMDVTKPFTFLMSLSSLAVIIPAIMIAMKITGLGGIGTLSSLAGRLRMDRIRGFLPWMLLVIIVTIAVETGYGILVSGVDSTIGTLRFLPLTVIFIVLVAPLQSAAEEYLFRGFLLQTLSAWLPLVIVPIVPLLAQALLFGSIHSQYNILGLIETGCMGLVAGYVAIKTGGIEGAIVIHAVNNTVAMLTTTIFSASNPLAETTVIYFVLNILCLAAYCILSMWVAKRKGWILK